MPFLPNIPLATDQLSVSQGNILNNFTILGAIAGNATTGSASINTVPGLGFNFLNFANQVAFVPSFNGNNGLWVGNFAHDATTTTELWAQYNQGTGGTAGQYQYPISASTLSLKPVNTVANPAPNFGWTYLSSGMIIKFGNATAGTPVNIDTASGGPAFTKVFVPFITPFGGASTYSTRTILTIAALPAAPNPVLDIVANTQTGAAANPQYYYMVLGF